MLLHFPTDSGCSVLYHTPSNSCSVCCCRITVQTLEFFFSFSNTSLQTSDVHMKLVIWMFSSTALRSYLETLDPPRTVYKTDTHSETHCRDISLGVSQMEIMTVQFLGTRCTWQYSCVLANYGERWFVMWCARYTAVNPNNLSKEKQKKLCSANDVISKLVVEHQNWKIK